MRISSSSSRPFVATAMILIIVVSGLAFLTLYAPIARVETAVRKGYDFLQSDLWSDSVGGYKEISDPSRLGNLALAYYYAWYGDPAHTTSWPNSSRYLPLLGGYNSSDVPVINQHLSWIKQAGLNGILVSYWDQLLSKNETFEDNTVRALFQTARQPDYPGMKIGVMMEQVVWNSTKKWQVVGNFSDPMYENALVKEMSFILSHYYLQYSDVYLTFNDKPVVGLYALLNSGHKTDENAYTEFFTSCL